MKIVMICALICCLSCTTQTSIKKTEFDWLDITISSAWDTSFSVKLNNNGEMFLGKGYPPKTQFKTNLQINELKPIDSLIQQSLKDLTDSIYESNKSDQVVTTLIVYKGSKKYKFYVEGSDAPTPLIALRNSIYEIATDQANFKASDTSINFESAVLAHPPKPLQRE